MSTQGWIGVDLDGTLAFYEGWQGEDHIGAPIALMVERVKGWLAAGREVRIFTARCNNGPAQCTLIDAWCEIHLGQVLPITATKDFHMTELWDDRCVQVQPNVGASQVEVLTAYCGGAAETIARAWVALGYDPARLPPFSLAEAITRKFRITLAH